MLVIWLAIVLIAREAVTGATVRRDVILVLILGMLWIVRWR
jgi:hypothetical protein